MWKRSFFFFKKRQTEYNPNYFRNLPVQNVTKISPANVACLLGTLNFLNVPDIYILLVKNSKIDAAFLIINH